MEKAANAKPRQISAVRNLVKFYKNTKNQEEWQKWSKELEKLRSWRSCRIDLAIPVGYHLFGTDFFVHRRLPLSIVS